MDQTIYHLTSRVDIHRDDPEVLYFPDPNNKERKSNEGDLLTFYIMTSLIEFL